MKRPLIYLFIVIVIAAIVYVIEGPNLPLSGDSSGEPIFPRYDAKEITRVEIGQLLTGVQIKKEGDGWLVADFATPMRTELAEKEKTPLPEPKWYSADTLILYPALGVFGDFPRGVVVSSNPEKHMLHQVTDPLGLHVKLYKGEEKVVDVTIGKETPDFSGNYVRVGESDDVVLSKRVLTDAFPVSLAEWRDRSIWNIKPDSINAISVQSQKGSYDLARSEDGKWSLAKSGTAIDQDKVKQFVARIANLKASGFANEGDPKVNFKNAVLTLVVTTKDGAAHELKLGGENNLRQYYARHEGNEQAYLIENPESIIPTDVSKLGPAK